MPGFLSDYDGTDLVRFGDYTVYLRQHLTGDAREKADNKRMRVAAHAASGQNGEQQLKVTSIPDPAAYKEELLLQGITDWDLTDRDGKLLPLSPEAAKRASIRMLPDEVYTILVDRLEANLAKARKTPEEHQKFRDLSDGADEGGLGDAGSPSAILAETGLF